MNERENFYGRVNNKKNLDLKELRLKILQIYPNYPK